VLTHSLSPAYTHSYNTHTTHTHACTNTSVYVDLIGGSEWLQDPSSNKNNADNLSDQEDDDDRSLLVAGVRRKRGGEELMLTALIDACGSEDNVLVFGVKELRNSLSSAGYRYCLCV